MPIDDLTRVFTTLFTAPTDAVVKAAAVQRRIWIDWLRDVVRLVEATDDADAKKRIIREHLALAPVWRISAQVSVGVTMRVASIKRTEGGASLGLGVGPIQASGSFGFMSESSSESVLQARAQYAVTNNDRVVTLEEYLATLDVTPTDAAGLTTAIDTLGVAAEAAP